MKIQINATGMRQCRRGPCMDRHPWIVHMLPRPAQRGRIHRRGSFAIAASIAFVAAAVPSFGSGASDSPTTNALVITLVTGEALGTQVFPTLEHYETSTGYRIAELHEAPMLAAMVAAGELPPVAERVGPDVQVIRPLRGTQPYASKLYAVAPQGRIDSLPEFFLQPIGKTQNALDLTPNLVREWELSADGTEVTLMLRKGMKWSDGEAVVADDFAFYYDAVLKDNRFSSTWRPPARLNFDDQLLSAKKIDDYTIKYHFSEEDVWKNLFLYSQLLGPKHYLKEWHDRYNPDATELAKEAGFDDWSVAFKALIESPSGTFSGALTAPGTNPYVLKDAAQDVAVWERNPYYWKIDQAGNQLPYIDEIQQVTDWSDIPTDVMTGSLHFPTRLTIFPQMPLYKKTISEDLIYLWDGTMPPATAIVLFKHSWDDTNAGQIQNDSRFREAISLAINQPELKSLLGFGESVAPDAARGWTGVEMAYDPERANQLLDEIGLSWDPSRERRLSPNDEPTTIIATYPESYPHYFEETAQRLKDSLAAVGIGIEYYRISDSEWQQRLGDDTLLFGGPLEGGGVGGIGLVDRYRRHRDDGGGGAGGSGGGGSASGGGRDTDGGGGGDGGSVAQPTPPKSKEAEESASGSAPPGVDEDDRIPWPLPKPTERHQIDRRKLQPDLDTAITIGGVDSQLRVVLKNAGFRDMGYQLVPAGFALITRMEKFDCDSGVSRTEDRWDTEYQPYQVGQGFIAYLKHLFTGAGPGCYRKYVLVVTTEDQFRTTLTNVKFDEEWTVPDLQALPLHRKDAPFGETHQAVVYIYMFFRDGHSAPVFYRRYPKLDPVHHITGSHLSDLLMEG